MKICMRRARRLRRGDARGAARGAAPLQRQLRCCPCSAYLSRDLDVLALGVDVEQVELRLSTRSPSALNLISSPSGLAVAGMSVLRIAASTFARLRRLAGLADRRDRVASRPSVASHVGTPNAPYAPYFLMPLTIDLSTALLTGRDVRAEVRHVRARDDELRRGVGAVGTEQRRPSCPAAWRLPRTAERCRRSATA